MFRRTYALRFTTVLSKTMRENMLSHDWPL